MRTVSHLLTTVDLADEDDDGPDARRLSVCARHELMLDDGRRVLLLDDRGWSGEIVSDPSAPEPSGIWLTETAASLESDARMVVGPDEPAGDLCHADMDAGHWDALAETARAAGVGVTGSDLRALRHDVELSDRVRARLSTA